MKKIVFRIIFLAFLVGFFAFCVPINIDAAGPVTFTIPANVAINEQFDLTVTVSNPTAKPRAMDAQVWVGGWGWSGWGGTYKTSKGSSAMLDHCAWRWCEYVWTGVVSPQSKESFVLTTSAGTDIGTFGIAQILWSIEDENGFIPVQYTVLREKPVFRLFAPFILRSK